MTNPILLCEVARLHQRDIEKEVASRQITNQVKSVKIDRPGTIKHFFMRCLPSAQDDRAAMTREAFSG